MPVKLCTSDVMSEKIEAHWEETRISVQIQVEEARQSLISAARLLAYWENKERELTELIDSHSKTLKIVFTTKAKE